MAGLMQRLVFPIFRRVHRGTLSALIPKRPCTTNHPEPLTKEEEENLKELFDVYDEDGSGEISADELYLIVDNMLHNKSNSMHIVHVSQQKPPGLVWSGMPWWVDNAVSRVAILS